jgi:integrase
MVKNNEIVAADASKELEKQQRIQQRVENSIQKAQKIQEQSKRHNSELAFVKDMEYFWAWMQFQYEVDEPYYPVSKGTIFTFVADHLEGLDSEVDKKLTELEYKHKLGPHKVSTVERRLSSLARAHNEYHEAGTGRKHVYSPEISALIKSKKKEAPKSDKKDAVTLDQLERLIAAIDVSTLRGILVRAVLSVAFASGGRRRSELCSMNVSDIRRYEVDQQPGYFFTIDLGETKTTSINDDESVPVMGNAALYLQKWLDASQVYEGRLFRAVRPNGSVSKQMSENWYRDRLKELALATGLELQKIGTHSIRAGFVTQCGKENVPFEDARQLSKHKSYKVFSGYYQAGNVINNQAAKLMSKKK